MSAAEHNPGEPEFGEHADEAEHNPGEFELGDGDGDAEDEEADAGDADHLASGSSEPGLEEDGNPFSPPELGPDDRA